MDSQQQQIMCAVQHVLIEHGYAATSIAKRADQADLGKSHLYYFDDKHDLMVAFLDFLIRKMKDSMQPLDDTDTSTMLETHLGNGLGLSDRTIWELRKALMEMRIQASHDEEMADRFNEIDEFLTTRLATLLDQYGVASSNEIASIVFKAIEGTAFTNLHQEAFDQREETKNQLKELIDSHTL